jgi:hypothetical protein
MIHCIAWQIDFKDVLHSRKIYLTISIKPISNAACGSLGDDGHSPCRSNVTASGSWQQNLTLIRCCRPKNRSDILKINFQLLKSLI